MSTLKIKKFNYAAADILSNLYSEHPVPVNGEELVGLSHDLGVVWEALQKEENPNEEYFSYLQVINHTLDWLQKAGFVTFEKMQGHRHPVNVCLTVAGFVAIRSMNTKPWWKFWAKPQPFDDYVQDLFKNQNSDSVSKLVTDALSAVIKLVA